jgi:hypothetical protein
MTDGLSTILLRAPPGDLTDSGDARTIKYRDWAKTCSIAGHSPGLAARLVLSRKTRSARSRYHGFAKRCNPLCSADANLWSPAWLYEMNAAYAIMYSNVVPTPAQLVPGSLFDLGAVLWLYPNRKCHVPVC